MFIHYALTCICFLSGAPVHHTLWLPETFLQHLAWIFQILSNLMAIQSYWTCTTSAAHKTWKSDGSWWGFSFYAASADYSVPFLYYAQYFWHRKHTKNSLPGLILCFKAIYLFFFFKSANGQTWGKCPNAMKCSLMACPYLLLAILT